MQKLRGAGGSALTGRIKPLALALSAMFVLSSTAYAASLGHSRIVSGFGQPLRIQVPIKQLTPDDARTLQVQVAPADAWRSAGLTPPVQLETLSVQVVPGAGPQSRIIQVASPQAFDGQVADLLLQARTASGVQLHQVSVLARASTGPAASSVSAAGPSGSGGTAATSGASRLSSIGQVQIRRGDTMFKIARAHPVEGVSVHQMMVALLQANPQAFIRGNLNLIRAGASLDIPGRGQLTAVSDAEARRILHQHTQDFNAWRQGAARGQSAAAGAQADQGEISNSMPLAAQASLAAQRDQVVLSSVRSAGDLADDDRAATSQNIKETDQRVSQLEQNVKSLNIALQSQGEAAKDAVLDGATVVGASIASLASSIAGDQSTTAAPRVAVASGSTDTAGKSDSDSSNANAGAGQPTGAKDSLGLPAGESGTASNPIAGGQASSTTNGAASNALDSTAGGSTASASGNASRTAPSAVPGITAGSGASAAATETYQTAENAISNSSNKEDQPVSWFQEYMLGIVTALLALIVLIIAWVLRRASSGRHDSDHPAPITEAMVKEQLEKINLDLHEPPTDERPVGK